MIKLTRSHFLRQLTLGLLSLCCVVIFAACGSTPNGASSGGTAPAASSETLKIALDPTFAPFQTRTADGKYEGFDIDLITAISEAAGFKMDLQQLPFDGIIPALQAGTVDATISTMTITAERAQTVDFSRPYFKAGLAIAVQDSNTDITSLETLKGKKVAVQIGTTGAETAKAAQPSDLRTFDNAPLALQELANGNVDAVVNDAPATLYAIKSGKIAGVKVVGQLVTEEYYGMATPKSSSNLEKINSGLATILSNGKYDEIYAKWFGGKPPTLPEKAPI